MKHQKTSQWLRWTKEALYKGLVILLVGVGGMYAYAQITWPSADPNPVSGVVGVFVGESSSAFNAASDYDKVNDFCANSSDANVKGSHICTPAEMANSYNNGQSGISPIYTYSQSPTLWINSGPPGYTANANDCKGWTAITSPLANPNYGTVWNFVNDYGSLLPCDVGKKFACCK